MVLRRNRFPSTNPFPEYAKNLSEIWNELFQRISLKINNKSFICLKTSYRN